MEKVTLKGSAMMSPVPAALVSCGTEDEKNLITVAWTGIINSQPPMTYISVRKSRFSHHIIEKTGEFVINLTTEDLARATDWCGVKSGRDFDKFKETGLTAGSCEEVGCPLVKEAPVNLECVVKEIKEFPSHDMFIAEIVKVHVSENLFDEDGRIRLDGAGMLAYCHGEYFGLKKHPIGKFGFSVMKPKTRKRLEKQRREKAVSGRHRKTRCGDGRENRSPEKSRKKSKTER
jgi:flavin reductase (DIM6/NTAB) family NADH-FMN oxidoreductase RutF